MNQVSELWQRGVAALGPLGHADLRTNTVLVVDDDPDICRTLSNLLRQRLVGITVLTAGNGQEAMAALAREPIHVIISDFQMPGMDGMSLLKRARLEHPSTVRLMLTAHRDLGLAQQAVNDEHVHSFLTKPVEPGRVVRQVADALLTSLRQRIDAQAAQAQDRILRDVMRLLREPAH